MVYFGLLLIVLSLLSSNSALTLPKAKQTRHILRPSEIIAPRQREIYPNDEDTFRRFQNGRLGNMAAGLKILKLDVSELLDNLNSNVWETATAANTPKAVILRAIANNVSPKKQRHPRQLFTKLFSRKEIDILKKIVRAIEDEERDNKQYETRKPKSALPPLEFEFSDLVL